jgi:hypothetical protein
MMEIHENCGGEIGSDGWTDAQVYWTCDRCGECWDDDDFFNLVKVPDEEARLAYIASLPIQPKTCEFF